MNNNVLSGLLFKWTHSLIWGSLYDKFLYTIWWMDMKLAYLNSHFFPKELALSTHHFLLLFYFILCGSMNRAALIPLPHSLPHIQRGSGCCQPLDGWYFFSMNMEGFDDILSLVRKKSLNTYILSYVIEAFIKIDSFWSHIWCRCFIHKLLFLQKLCGSYFIFLGWICHDLFFC